MVVKDDNKPKTHISHSKEFVLVDLDFQNENFDSKSIFKWQASHLSEWLQENL